MAIPDVRTDFRIWSTGNDRKAEKNTGSLLFAARISIVLRPKTAPQAIARVVRTLDGTMESPIIANLPAGHRMDRLLGVVYDRTPGHSDDLTQIDGIRTREAVLLNQMGVYFYGQVALWRHREISVIADELQIPVSRIVDEGWTGQAKALCRLPATDKVSSLPASILRTVLLLACALLIGFFTVYLLGRQRNEPLTGVLSADITSIKVPAASRLTSVHVKSGDEVFSGQPLLTLEKLEHLDLITRQESIVRDLERELRRAEAQAAIELEWRKRDLDRELAGLRIELSQREATVAASQLPEMPAPRVTSRKSESPISAGGRFVTASKRHRAGGILFFGASGLSSTEKVSTAAQLQPVPAPVRVAEVTSNGVMSDSPAALFPSDLQAELFPADSLLESLRSDLQHLKSVQSSLPTTVSEAIGVISLKSHFADAMQHLNAMKSVSREVNVQSPVYGTIGQVRYRPGDDMHPGDVMVRILHTDRRYIMVFLPTKRVHEMQPGHEVELVFPGKQQYRGQIVDIPMMADATAESGDTLAAVRIEPSGRLWPNVPVGSQVDVISLK